MSVYNKNEIPDDLQQYFVRAEIGLEETPEQYIAKLVEVFRCVREVLADDGTLWVNIGDSYATGTKADRQQSTNPGVGANRPEAQNSVARIGTPAGCKTKDLIGIPWMLAFALRAGFSACTCCGVERRSDLWPVHNGHRVCIECLIEWRHESKIVQTEPGWYLRQDIIWHKPNPMPESVTDRCTKGHEYLFLLSKSPRYYFDAEAIKEPAVSEKPAGNKNHKYADAYAAGGSEEHRTKAGLKELAGVEWQTRNRRSVWSIATKPYKGAHFAVFPPDLVEPCILAGSRPGDVVLDCFMGSGTTAAVAIEHGRQFVGCELNADYKPLQDERIANAHALVAEREQAKADAARQFSLLDQLFAPEPVKQVQESLL